MEGAPSESHAPGSPINPQLRQRMLNRAATFAEGAQSSPPALPLRRGSVFSNYSDTRHSFRSSTDNLLRTNVSNDMERPKNSDEPSYWISLPVVFAIVPAIIGFMFDNGTAIATDLVILALAGWFLHWFVKVPWDWYHQAQELRYESSEYNDDNGMRFDDSILEEDEEGNESTDERTELNAKDAQEPGVNSGISPSRATAAQENARKALRRQEDWAFAGVFIGPVLGAALLHAIRGQLTRTEGIVSDFNVAIFLLVAEIQPVRRLIELRSEKIWHLQRIVRQDPSDNMRPADAQQLSQRIAELEARLEGPITNTDVDLTKLSAEVRQSTQLQLDALNRAVRRYEKRHMAQSLQTEARFQDLETRLKDALALAAAAARSGQQPGIISATINWIMGMISYAIQTAWNIALSPLRAAAAGVVLVKSLFIKEERQSRRRGKGQTNGYSSISTPRMQSKSGR